MQFLKIWLLVLGIVIAASFALIGFVFLAGISPTLGFAAFALVLSGLAAYGVYE